jgi:peroxiredoxin
MGERFARPVVEGEMSMAIPRIGERAPSFRLPVAQGGELGLEDFANRRAVIVWFTKGMACAFCRQQMSQIGRAYRRIAERNAEVLEIVPSSLARAQFYARRFALPFPYLCDVEGTAKQAWGLEKRSHGLGYYVKTFVMANRMPKPENDYGTFKPSLGEIPATLADEDMGFFIVDRAGVVRYALTGAYIDAAGPRPVPGPDEILRELDRCAAAA